MVRSLTLTRYWWAILLSVSPAATVWTGGTGSKVCTEPAAAEAGKTPAPGAATGAPGAGAPGESPRGAAAWATLAPLP